MKKQLLLITIVLVSLAFTKEKEKEVFICKTVTSKRYHFTKTCKGLKKCSGTIGKTTQKKAKKVGLTPCKLEVK